MTSIGTVIKSVGPKLVPFFKTVAIYFVVFLPNDRPSVLGAVLKCLPIISLMLFVYLHGEGLSETYNIRIFTGLLFCCLGDALLVWNAYFEMGMVAFMLGHIHYILAFGFEPLSVPIAVFSYILGIKVVHYLQPDLQGALIVGIPVYACVLTTTVWRAAARVQFFDDNWSWIKFFTFVGSVLFAISDLIIAVNRFKFSTDYSQVLVMSTYYAAQLGISLSVLDAKSKVK